MGTGEFSDVRLLVDWAKKTGLRLIQILPVNDTSATHTWLDSYPYAAISAFALHPLYLNLEKMAGKKYAALIKPLKKIQKQLKILPDLDYEEVMRIKIEAAKEIFTAEKENFLVDEDFMQFFEENKTWWFRMQHSVILGIQWNGRFGQWKTFRRYRLNWQSRSLFLRRPNIMTDRLPLFYSISSSPAIKGSGPLCT